VHRAAIDKVERPEYALGAPNPDAETLQVTARHHSPGQHGDHNRLYEAGSAVAPFNLLSMVETRYCRGEKISARSTPVSGTLRPTHTISWTSAN
jgi:hypothetical protein